MIPPLSPNEQRIALAGCAAVLRALAESEARGLERDIADLEDLLSRSVGSRFRANIEARIGVVRDALADVIEEIDAIDAVDAFQVAA